MKKKSIIKTLKKSIYLNSFKNIKILLAAFYYILFMGGSYIFSLIFRLLVERLRILEFLISQGIDVASEQVMLQTTAAVTEVLQKKLFVLIIYMIIFFIFLIANWSFFEGLIWNLIYKKKYSVKQFFRFFLFNILFFLATMLLTLLIAASVRNNIASWLILFVIIFSVYFITACYIAFFRTKKGIKAVKLGWKISILKIHKFLPVFLLAALTMFILLGIISKLTILISPTAVSIGFFLWFIMAMPWFKFYLKAAAEKIE